MSDYVNIVVSIKGRELGRFSFSKPEIIIGREAGVDVFLDNAGVSRQHACISASDEGIAIADLQSNNGTFVNGAPIKSSPLAPGDELRIGKFSLDVTQSNAPFDAASLSGNAPIDGAAASSAHAPEPVGPDSTVLVTPEERQRLLREKAAEPVITPQQADAPRTGRLLIIGIAIGVIITWLLL